MLFRSKKIEDQEKNLDQKFEEIKVKEGDLLTLEGCKKLQRVAEEMREEENSHPLVQEKYLQFLVKKGCNVFDYDIYADVVTRTKVAYKIEEAIVEQKDVLKEAEASGTELEEKLTNSFALRKISTLEDIKVSKELVDVLSHKHYPLRKKAFQTLLSIAGESKGYSPEAIESERLKLFPNGKIG